MRFISIKKDSVAGFTLIELLVVISIIALLSSVVLSSLSAARGKARDARRKADLYQIRTALEAYFADRGYYPNESVCDSSKGIDGVTPCTTTSPTGTSWSPTSAIYSALVPAYITSLPVDPVNSGAYYYNYEPNGPSQGICGTTVCEYTLWANLENGGDHCLGSANPRTITCTP